MRNLIIICLVILMIVDFSKGQSPQDVFISLESTEIIEIEDIPCYRINNLYVGLPIENVEAQIGNKININLKGFDFIRYKDMYLYFYKGFLYRITTDKRLDLPCKFNNDFAYSNNGEVRIVRTENKTMITSIPLWEWSLTYNITQNKTKPKLKKK